MIPEINNLAIADSFTKCASVLEKYEPREVCVSVSGGSDSDIMVDMMSRFDFFKDLHFTFFDTGMELAATKRHLAYLEERYGIKIERVRAFETVPQAVREYGQPFLSKYCSSQIEDLQKFGFEWDDLPYAELVEKYHSTRWALKWFTNEMKPRGDFKTSMFQIAKYKGLREFLIAYPPPFKVSAKCCNYAKKKTAHRYDKENGIKLDVIGVRKAEGGIRAAGKACFTDAKNGRMAKYRPLFWYSDKDKRIYEETFGIVHSDCYTVYGFKRTGCTGCPFARALADDLPVIAEHEPLMYRACQTVFRESYEYTQKYREFVKELKLREKGFTSLWDYKEED